MIQWWKNTFFSKKLRKIAQRLGASPPDPHRRRQSAVATGGQGRVVPPLTTAFAPHFSLLKIRYWNIT